MWLATYLLYFYCNSHEHDLCHTHTHIYHTVLIASYYHAFYIPLFPCICTNTLSHTTLINLIRATHHTITLIPHPHTLSHRASHHKHTHTDQVHFLILLLLVITEQGLFSNASPISCHICQDLIPANCTDYTQLEARECSVNLTHNSCVFTTCEELDTFCHYQWNGFSQNNSASLNWEFMSGCVEGKKKVKPVCSFVESVNRHGLKQHCLLTNLTDNSTVIYSVVFPFPLCKLY